MLGFPPVPVRSSLINLLVQDSSCPTMLMPILVRTPSQHDLNGPRPPKLTSASSLASQKQDYRTLPNIPAGILFQKQGQAFTPQRGLHPIYRAATPTRLRGATVARLTPDQKAACSNHVGVKSHFDVWGKLCGQHNPTPLRFQLGQNTKLACREGAQGS